MAKPRDAPPSRSPPMVSSTPIVPTDSRALAVPARAERLELLRNGERAFSRILARIASAQRSIRLRCFDWRDDATGQAIASALLDAADRGVAVFVEKDRVGANYEYLEGSRQSLLHKDVEWLAVLQTWFLMATYWRIGSFRQKPSPLAEALLSHPNVRIERDELRFDHSKVWVFDDDVIILGGMGIGDDFHHDNVDFMVEVVGAEAVRRFHEIEADHGAFNPVRPLDFLMHTRGRNDDTLLNARLELLSRARERLTIEMAYLGDPRFTDAVVDAVRRGVRVTILTSRRANIIGDLNLGTCARILRRTGAPENLRIALHPRLVHGKAFVVDGHIVDIGSANFTNLSHAAYAEVDLYVQDPTLAAQIEAEIEREIDNAELVGSRLAYRRPHFWVETAILVYQSKKGLAARTFAPASDDSPPSLPAWAPGE
jgi:cardiolipin synthase